MRLRIARPLGPANFPACLIARRPPLLPGLRARHQADIVGHVVIIRDNNAPAGIDCNAAPVRSSIISGIFNGTTVAFGVRVETFITRLAELNEADHLIDRLPSLPVMLLQFRLATLGPLPHPLTRLNN